MGKKFLKRYIPDHEKIRRDKTLNRLFGSLLHNPNLLHVNRRSVSGAFFVGLFMAFIPLPGQMILAAGAAILWRVNLPISVALVWVTNPVTIPPMFYFAYKIGLFVLGQNVQVLEFHATLEWFSLRIGEIWEPLLVGSLICGVTTGLAGMFATRLVWRIQVVRRWQRKKQRYKEKLNVNDNAE